MKFFYGQRRKKNAGRCVSGDGLDQNIALQYTAVHNALQQYRLGTIRDDYRIFLGDDSFKPFNRIVQHNIITAYS